MKFARFLSGISLTLFLGFPVACDAGQADPKGFDTSIPQDNLAASLATLEAKVQSWVDSGAVVGAEYLIIKGDEIVLHGARGLRDREKGHSMVINTIFDIQSMTKPIVATGIFRLATEGRLDIDDKVSKYLPSFEKHSTTIRQLLSRTDGFTRMPITPLSFPSLMVAVNELGRLGPDSPPGSVYARNSSATITLGAIIESVTGVLLPEYLSETVLSDLKMTDNTYVSLAPDSPWRARMSSVYLRNGAQFQLVRNTAAPTIFRFFPGAAGLYSTPIDYAKFLRLWLNRGRIGAVQYIDEKYVNEALTLEPLSMMVSTSYGQTPYGLHWDLGPSVLRPGTGIASFGHPGASGTIGWVVPEKELIILYFTQSGGGTTHYQFVEEAIKLLAN